MDSYDSLPQEKSTAFDVMTLIKSVFNKDENNYWYNIFLGKATHDLLKK